MKASWYNKRSMSGTGRSRLNQAGMVSLTVTFIMMLVITLIIVGFSQVTQRNIREALDRQLSAQAFYAAESGINVTSQVLKNYVLAGNGASLISKTSCQNDYDPSRAGAISATAPADLGNGVRYTCVLVSTDLDNLAYNSVTASGSTVSPISATDGSNLQKLTFSWDKQPNTADNVCTNRTSAYIFPPSNQWQCGAGILRLDLVKVPAGNLDSTVLASNAVTFFLTPYGDQSGAVGMSNYSDPKAFVASAANCDTGTCRVTITLPGDSANYYARMTSIYRDAPNVVIRGTLTNGAAAHFNGQAIVDVTGQSQDELRRVQARVQLVGTSDTGQIPLSAVSSGSDICKKFAVLPTTVLGTGAALCN